MRMYGNYVSMCLYVHRTCFSRGPILLQPHNIDIRTFVQHLTHIHVKFTCMYVHTYVHTHTTYIRILYHPPSIHMYVCICIYYYICTTFLLCSKRLGCVLLRGIVESKGECWRMSQLQGNLCQESSVLAGAPRRR